MASFTPSRREFLSGLMASSAAGQAIAANKVLVDLALVLAIDVSYSVDPLEYQIQMRGTGQAFRAPEVLEAVSHGPKKQIAVCAFLWSDPVTKTVILPWQIFRGPDDAAAISARFFQAARGVEKGTTATGSALRFGQDLLDVAPKALRHVIDISTDGTCNEGPPAPQVRDEVVAKGTVINGLAITKDLPYLGEYMKTDVVGGRDHFVVEANDFNAYGGALRQKLFREIMNVDLI